MANDTTASEKVKIKLVGGARYHCHKVKDDVILKNEVIEVDRALADLLLDDGYVDGLGNEHPYFVETTDEEESAKAKRAARRAAKTTDAAAE